MSRSAIQCKRCGAVLAYRRQSGRVTVAAGVKVVLVAGGTQLTCPCGAKRTVTATG